MPLAVAQPPGYPLAGEAQEIVQVARSGLRQLRGRPVSGAASVEAHRREAGRFRRLVARIRGSEAGELPNEEVRAVLGSIILELDARIENFITLAALVGSPPDYQQELRTSRLKLLSLMDEGAEAQQISTASYTTLTHVVDLVDLTRRDVERRALEQPKWAARMMLAELPTAEESRVARVAGFSYQELVRCASSTTCALAEPDLHRLRVVTQLIYDLRYSHTPEGLLDWFEQSFDHLGQRSPLDLLDDWTDENEQTLRAYARSLRVQTAT